MPPLFPLIDPSGAAAHHKLRPSPPHRLPLSASSMRSEDAPKSLWDVEFRLEGLDPRSGSPVQTVIRLNPESPAAWIGSSLLVELRSHLPIPGLGIP